MIGSPGDTVTDLEKIIEFTGTTSTLLFIVVIMLQPGFCWPQPVHLLSTSGSRFTCDLLISKSKEHISVLPTDFLATSVSGVAKTIRK